MMRLLIVFYSSSLCYSSCLFYSILFFLLGNKIFPCLFVLPVPFLRSSFIFLRFICLFGLIWFGLAWLGLAWFGLAYGCVVWHTFSSLSPILILRHISITPTPLSTPYATSYALYSSTPQLEVSPLSSPICIPVNSPHRKTLSRCDVILPVSIPLGFGLFSGVLQVDRETVI